MGFEFLAAVVSVVASLGWWGYLVRGRRLSVQESRRRREVSRLRYLLAGVGEGYHVLDSHGRLVEASESFLKLLGYAVSDVGQLSITDWDVSGSVALVGLRLMAPPGCHETRYLRRDGTVIDVEVSCHRLDIEGERLLVQSARDIGERRIQMIERLHGEAELRANGARLRMMLETTAEGVIGIDDEARVMFANRAAGEILGWTRRVEMMGKSSGDVLGHRLGDGARCDEESCAIRKTLSDSRTRRVSDETFQRQSGRLVPIEYVVSPLVVEDVTIGAVVAFHDITERKALEQELRRSNTELEQFAYVTSHDLRQPLRMISSYLSLIHRRLKDRMDADEEQFISFAVDGAKRMDALILGLLEHSRVGRDDVRDNVNLTEVVQEVLQNLSFAISDAEGRVEVFKDLPTVIGDRLELMRLFQNLIGNALKYRLPDRPPVVEVGWRDEAESWVVWVQDNGIGIAVEDFDRVFGIFQRLVTGDQYEGTGIGLAICRKIVEHHDGRIWIESEMDRGTRMLISLPKHRHRRVGTLLRHQH